MQTVIGIEWKRALQRWTFLVRLDWIAPCHSRKLHCGYLAMVIWRLYQEGSFFSLLDLHYYWELHLSHPLTPPDTTASAMHWVVLKPDVEWAVLRVEHTSCLLRIDSSAREEGGVGDFWGICWQASLSSSSSPSSSSLTATCKVGGRFWGICWQAPLSPTITE